MARRPRSQSKTTAPVPRLAVCKHIAALGYRSVGDYISWCRDNGFAANPEKSRAELEHEVETWERAQQRRSQATRIHHNPAKLIEDACAGKINPSDITRDSWRRFCQSIHASREDRESRDALKTLLLRINDRCKFVAQSTTFGGVNYSYVDALIKINDRRGQWIRPITDWRPHSHNDRRQFASLARHLLAQYPVPGFMDQAWFRSDRGAPRLRDWFIHIGSGKNIRTAKTPIPMTKMMAHHFVDAPDDYTIEAAMRWGQVHALGGDRRLTEAILGSRIREDFTNNDFWTSVIRFFVANPLLERSFVGPIIDFLNHQKFETQDVMVGPGEVEVQQPPQPKLSMRGRTADSLMGQVERWHAELGREHKAKDYYFKKVAFEPFALRVGKDGKTIWTIRQLLSGADLIGEGKRMRHCVASYARACARGDCSIWSMEMRNVSGLQKRQTVEVNRHGVIVQCRGKQNRLPTHTEFDVLRKWSGAAGLTVSRYVVFQD